MMKVLSAIPCYALYTLLIFTPLARASVQGWAISSIHLITLIALTALLLAKALTLELTLSWEWIKTPLEKPIVILIILCILSSVYSVHRQTSIWSTILLLNYLAIYYLVIHTVRTRSQFRHLIYLVIGVAAFLSIFGLIKLSGVNPFPWWEYTDIRQVDYRLSSTFGNPDHLAGYMEMTIPLLLGLFLTGFRGVKLFWMICMALILTTALIFSLSRGGWIGAFIGLSFMAFALLTDRHFMKKRLIVVLICGFFAVMFIVLTSTPVVERIRTFEEMENIPTLRSRVKVWGGTVKMIQDYPLLGAGPGAFATVFTQYQPPGLASRYFYGHGDYLHFTAELGLLLVPIILWIIIALYKITKKDSKS